MTLDPFVVPVMPGPIARDPDMARRGRRAVEFMARRRRTFADDDLVIAYALPLTPVSLDKRVTIPATFPARLDPDGAEIRRTVPMAANPDVTAVGPGPISADPDIVAARAIALDDDLAIRRRRRLIDHHDFGTRSGREGRWRCLGRYRGRRRLLPVS